MRVNLLLCYFRTSTHSVIALPWNTSDLLTITQVNLRSKTFRCKNRDLGGVQSSVPCHLISTRLTSICAIQCIWTWCNTVYLQDHFMCFFNYCDIFKLIVSKSLSTIKTSLVVTNYVLRIKVIMNNQKLCYGRVIISSNSVWLYEAPRKTLARVAFAFYFKGARLCRKLII